MAPVTSKQNLRIIEKVGTEQFNDFIHSRLLERKIPISDTIKKNKLHIFSTHTKVPSKKDEQLKSAKDSISLFSRLFIACQRREGDLDTFFVHENQPCPSTLAEKVEIRPTKAKSDVIDCILPPSNNPNECPPVDVKIYDGPAIVNMLHPTNDCKTFLQYAEGVFIPFILNCRPSSVKRIDIVWDRYFENSFKIRNT